MVGILMKHRCDNCNAVDTMKKCPKCGALCHPLPAIKCRWRPRVSHIQAEMFVGEDIEHLALAGTLRLRPTEWKRLRGILDAGTDAGQCELVFEDHTEVDNGK